MFGVCSDQDQDQGQGQGPDRVRHDRVLHPQKSMIERPVAVVFTVWGAGHRG